MCDLQYPHIVALSEHWQNQISMHAYQIKGYNLVTCYCRKNSLAHGGVALYGLSNLKAMVRSDITNLSLEYVFECCAAEFVIENNIYIIVVIYSPPPTNLEIFLEKLEELLLLALADSNKIVTIVGDFNIDMLIPALKLPVKILLNSYNMCITINKPTRVTAASATCLDNIYIQNNINYEDDVIKTDISDHSGQILKYKTKKENKKSHEFKRCFSKENYDSFFNLLSGESWISVYNKKSLDDQYNSFISIILHYFNLCFPVCKRRIRNKCTVSKNEWMDAELSKVKNTLSFLLECCSLNSNFRVIYNQYKEYYSKMILQKKKLYYDKLIDCSENKTKTIWQIINSNLKSKQCYDFDEIVFEDEIIQCPQEAANVFNQYFTNLGKRTTNSDNNYKSQCKRVLESMVLLSTSEDEVKTIISSLKNSCSSGDDGFSNVLIKRISEYIIEPLTFLLNQSLVTGIFPSKLKIAVVKPLFKKGDPCCVENYRPISLLSSFSKIFEVAYYKRLVSFLDSKNVILQSQHGFRSKLSTITAVFHFIKEIYDGIDNGKVALGVFRDLSKAFLLTLPTLCNFFVRSIE